MTRAELLACLSPLALAAGCDGVTSPPPDAGPALDVEDKTDVVIPERVTWSVVQPVYLRNCGGCHGGQSRGGTDFAIDYDDAVAESDSCPPDHLLRPLRVAQCAVERVDAGTMPPNGVQVSEADAEIMRRFLSSGLDPE
ncbi:MAG: hypothetical protein IV100_28425 [Myxococcales bacterium]|nr:hypothetical protein [Myxococcales bacterium]